MIFYPFVYINFYLTADPHGQAQTIFLGSNSPQFCCDIIDIIPLPRYPVSSAAGNLNCLFKDKARRSRERVTTPIRRAWNRF